MRNLPNLEPSAFRKGEYVGYANGVWRIRRVKPRGWIATKADGSRRLVAGTLEEMSAKLEATK